MRKNPKAPGLLSLDDHISLLDGFDSAEQDFKDLIYARIAERSEFDAGTECIIYTGSWEPSGQAKMRVGAQVYCLSRITAWIYFPGFKMWGVQRVVRTCDAPACCNPDHVRVLADQAAAMNAQRDAGRIGDPRKQLNRARASALLRDHHQGATIPELVRRYRIKRRAVRAVILGRTWAPK